MKRRALLLLLLTMLLGGCGGKELYSQLTERQANEMIAVLHHAGIPAEKHDLGKGMFSVSTPSRYFADAVENLHLNGYPREEFESLGDVFRKEGFVSSPLEEHARLMFALSQEIAHTIANIDGVVTARVHLAVPEQKPLDETVRPSSASVFIKHRKEVDLSDSISKIKSIVVNGVEGLPYDNVTVALFAMEPLMKAQPRAALPADGQLVISRSTALAGGLGAVALIFAGVAVWLWRRHRQQRFTALEQRK